MKKLTLIILAVVVILVLGVGFYIYSQKTVQISGADNAAGAAGAGLTAGTSSAAISSDIDSILQDVAGIDTNDTALTPISTADLSTD